MPNTYDAQRKRQQRTRESEEQRNTRLLNDRLQKQMSRQDESEMERNVRLADKQIRTEISRQNESEAERDARLADKRIRSEISRQNENETERDARRADKRMRSEISRQNESETKRDARLLNDRVHTQITREKESDDQRKKRLSQQRKRTLEHRSNSKQRGTAHVIYGATSSESEELTLEQVSKENSNMVVDSLPPEQIVQRNQPVARNQYVWPRAIPTKLKEDCLEEFSNHMSMSFLRQSVCVICNSRADFSSMKEYPLENIPNLERLSCHPDILNIISKTQQLARGIDMSSQSRIFFSCFSSKIIIQTRFSLLRPTLCSTRKDITQRPKLGTSVTNATAHWIRTDCQHFPAQTRCGLEMYHLCYSS